jgi:hemerythrin-like domain-containing protein
MNAFSLLKEDHRKTSRLIEQLSATSEAAVKTRERLFHKLYREVYLHSRIEEELLYPVLKESERTRKLVAKAVEEHRVIKYLLNELRRSEKFTEQWAARLTILKEHLEHHVKEEEQEIFKKADTVLSDRQLELLGARIATEMKNPAKYDS